MELRCITITFLAVLIGADVRSVRSLARQHYYEKAHAVEILEVAVQVS